MGRKVSGTVPLRKRAVTKRSFGRSSSNLSYLFNAAAQGTDEKEKIALWNKYIPLTPATAAKILNRDLPPDTMIVLELKDDGSGEILMTASGKFNDDRSFELEDKTLDCGIIRVDKDYQGQGVGRTIMRNELEFFYACGVRRFEITAALDNGGYTWARVGFLPDDVKAEDFREYVIAPAKATLDILSPILTQAEVRQLKKYLRFEKRENLWDVADAKVDLGGRLKDAFNRAADRTLPKAEKRAAKDFIKNLKDYFEADVFDYMKERAAQGKPVMVGRLLLTGTSWDGSLNLNNAKQMKRAGSYAGGWRYLKVG